MEIPAGRGETRFRIVESAARLLRDQGPDAVTTRGVAEAAGVQAPTIYRLFGDKDGLLDAVAEHVMARFVQDKAAIAAAEIAAETDPVEDLHAGWITQIEFGLANPTLFRLLSDPERVRPSVAAQTGRQVLTSRVHRIAVGGRLRVSERRAVDLIQAAGIGTIHQLLSVPESERDDQLAKAMYAAVLGQILTPSSSGQPDDRDDRHDRDDRATAPAVALRAVAPELTVLTGAERALLVDWMDRVVAST